MFDNVSLDKINKLIEKINVPMCKVPYGATTDEREKNDNLPFHFTISAWDKRLEDNIINMLKDINFKPIHIFIDKVEIMNSKENSFVLYLLPREDNELRNILKLVYKDYPTEKYNPDTFLFHITVDVDKDFNKVESIRNILLKDFVPFEIIIDKLGLFEIYPAIKIYEK
jgi:2'-5' RNA ligase